MIQHVLHFICPTTIPTETTTASQGDWVLGTPPLSPPPTLIRVNRPRSALLIHVRLALGSHFPDQFLHHFLEFLPFKVLLETVQRLGDKVKELLSIIVRDLFLGEIQPTSLGGWPGGVRFQKEWTDFGCPSLFPKIAR